MGGFKQNWREHILSCNCITILQCHVLKARVKIKGPIYILYHIMKNHVDYGLWEVLNKIGVSINLVVANCIRIFVHVRYYAWLE